MSSRLAVTDTSTAWARLMIILDTPVLSSVSSSVMIVTGCDR